MSSVSEASTSHSLAPQNPPNPPLDSSSPATPAPEQPKLSAQEQEAALLTSLSNLKESAKQVCALSSTMIAIVCQFQGGIKNWQPLQYLEKTHLLVPSC